MNTRDQMIKQAVKNYAFGRFSCILNIRETLKNRKRKTCRAIAYLFTIIFIFIFFVQMFAPARLMYADAWLKADSSDDEKIWVDTSHWESEKVYIKDGYYRDIEKKRWVDTSYTVKDGRWETGHYRVWVKSSQTLPYTAYRYVDTSHWETEVKYVQVQKPVFFSRIYGTDSYGWSVYSFAAKYKGMKQVIYNGDKYLVHVYVIDYRPARGGQVYAYKYVFVFKFVSEMRTSKKWVSSGYWQSYTAYRVVDTSHWEERSGTYWVDTSYTVNSGYWETYYEKQWVDKSYYETRKVWVKSGYYTDALHGRIIVKKNPEYVFTRWHKDGQGKDCGMELIVQWEIDNIELKDGEPPKKIKKAYIYQETVRYRQKGIIKTVLYNDAVGPSEKGTLETFSIFDYAGNEDSILHIYLYADSGESIHVYFSNPINGYRSINIVYGGTGKNPESFLGGNNYGEVIF